MTRRLWENAHEGLRWCLVHVTLRKRCCQLPGPSLGSPRSPRSPDPTCPSCHKRTLPPSLPHTPQAEHRLSSANALRINESGEGKVWITQSCPIPRNPTDCSPPGSSGHGILQARILGWVAVPFSRGSFQPRDWTQVSCFAGRFFTIWATGGALD